MSDMIIAQDTGDGVGHGSYLADWAGMVASIACAIHCAAMPLVLAYLPALGLGWLADEGFHRWMAVICFGLAAFAFVPGWRKHGNLTPAIWGAAGVIMLMAAAFGLEGGCCASCSAESTNVVAVKSCVDDACSLCSSTSSGESESSNLLARIVPFVTPLGGALLVIGHIVNHRKSCLCSGSHCCLTTVERECDE